MPTYFDLEATDKVVANVDRVHCIVLKHDDGPTRLFSDAGDGEGTLAEGLDELSRAEEPIAFNGDRYDWPVLEKMYDLRRPNRAKDALVISRLVFPSLKRFDFALVRRGRLPAKYVNHHTLAAWAYRAGLSVRKGDNSEMDWSRYTPEMGEYCRDDVEVLAAMWGYLTGQKPSDQSVALEHAFADAIAPIERDGVRFDADGAKVLAGLMEAYEDEMAGALDFPDFAEEYVTPKKKLRRVRVTRFNPKSRWHLARALMTKYGWKPKKFGKDGKPSMADDILATLDFPEVGVMRDLLMVSKRRGTLQSGTQSFLNHVRDGRVYPRVIHNATITHRCSHSKPNYTQTSAVEVDDDGIVRRGVDGKFGPEMRSLWLPDEGHVMVGMDASSIDLRAIAHYLAPLDDGAMARSLEEGDPHTANARAAGLERPDAKMCLYATSYGAGAARIAAGLKVPIKRASAIRKQFLEGTRLGPLHEKLEKWSKKHRGFAGLDGRFCSTDQASHAPISVAGQAGAGVAIKAWTVRVCREAEKLGAHLRLHAHDEMQFSCPPEAADELMAAGLRAIEEAGEELNMRVRLKAEAKKGASWRDTH